MTKHSYDTGQQPLKIHIAVAAVFATTAVPFF